MNSITPRAEQVVAAHSALILAVAHACAQPARRPEVESVLTEIERYGDAALARALREVLSGRRDESLLRGLDADDRIVVERVLLGLRDPATLPPPDAKPDPSAAAPGLAAIVHSAACGDHGALHALGEMSEQMQRVGGDMARVGAVLSKLLQGERDPDVLCTGAGAQCQSLVLSILDELALLDRH